LVKIQQAEKTDRKTTTARNLLLQKPLDGGITHINSRFLLFSQFQAKKLAKMQQICV